MNQHIVQTPEWGEFKTNFGTHAVQVGELQYTIHKVPYTNFSYAYCPKVDPFKIDWEELTKSLKDNNCFVINFDVPNVLINSENFTAAKKIFEEKEQVKKSPKNTFTKHNILMDITASEEELLANMHKKHRYNVGYAERKGVTIREAKTEEDYEIFYTLLQETAKRQNFLVHPNKYYKKIWDLFKPKNMVHILIAEFENTPLSAWMLFTHNEVLYYPYGASSTEHSNLQASSLIAWEAIKIGKKHECKKFDMWGACENPDDKTDPEWGFTNFKLRFGGKHVTYMDSYDYVLNQPLYKIFNLAYPQAIKFIKLLKNTF